MTTSMASERRGQRKTINKVILLLTESQINISVSFSLGEREVVSEFWRS